MITHFPIGVNNSFWGAVDVWRRDMQQNDTRRDKQECEWWQKMSEANDIQLNENIYSAWMTVSLIALSIIDSMNDSLNDSQHYDP